MTLRPFFSFFGSKWRLAPEYPRPQYRTIVESFAGSAGYSLHYPYLTVILVDADPTIAGLWRYLIGATPAEIMSLPDLEPGQDADDLNLPQEARWLIGRWVNKGSATPCQSPSQWMRKGAHTVTDLFDGGERTLYETQFWGHRIRQRIAIQLPQIRHWQVIEGDYRESPDIKATHFVDPPYLVAGRHYRIADLDYRQLGAWCRSRQGQVMVTENEGATWLDFVPFRRVKGTCGAHRTGISKEVIWTTSDVDEEEEQ